ncbi:MAG: SEL1-like repeat protein [Aestuariibacter sp.]|nr:SEL1-like repeat protein [Aestuariibacter sp.]
MKTVSKSALQSPLASFTLSILILFGVLGCNKPAFIKEWQNFDDLETAANKGDTDSQFRLGMRYTNGHGVVQDHATAVNWFKKAAQSGHNEAQFMLGAALHSGRGIEKSRSQSISWYTKSAEAGHMRSQYQLGSAYLNGRGVTQDRAWGARWYGMSASQGHKEAQFYLGALYSKGLGLPKSKSKSLFWLRASQLAGFTPAIKALKKLKLEVSDSQYATAIAKASNWKPSTKLIGLNNRPTLVYIQHMLNQLGYSAGFPDGIRGPNTAQAMSTFQSDRGLKSSSLQITLRQLRKESPGLN